VIVHADAGSEHDEILKCHAARYSDSGLVLPLQCVRLSPQPSVAWPSGGDEQYLDPVLHSVAGRTLCLHPSSKVPRSRIIRRFKNQKARHGL
jgi:hypothetical protein